MNVYTITEKNRIKSYANIEKIPYSDAYGIVIGTTWHNKAFVVVEQEPRTEPLTEIGYAEIQHKVHKMTVYGDVPARVETDDRVLVVFRGGKNVYLTHERGYFDDSEILALVRNKHGIQQAVFVAQLGDKFAAHNAKTGEVVEYEVQLIDPGEGSRVEMIS